MARILLLVLAALVAVVSAEEFVVRPGQRFVIELAETPVSAPAPPPMVEAPTPEASAPTPAEAPGPALASPPSPPAPAPGTPAGVVSPGPGGPAPPSSAISRTVALGSIAGAIIFSLFA